MDITYGFEHVVISIVSSFSMSGANEYDETENHEESANWYDGLLLETMQGHDLVYRVR